MRFVVFQCRKCGHRLFVENTDEAIGKIGKVSNMDCPECGEEPEGNWVLVGLHKEFPEKEFFTPEDVRKMSREEVRKNYQAIMKSMKEW